MSDRLDDAHSIWGGRFSGGPAPEMIAFTTSIDVDIRLLPYDLRVTKAHARGLQTAKLLESADVAAIEGACDDIEREWLAGTIHPIPEDEDVHTLVERELTARVGEPGARIHAGRSRNDLVATDLRLWCKDASGDLIEATRSLMVTLADAAEQHLASVMPAYTHLQRAQPVTLGFHLVAHAIAFERDIHRFGSALESADVCPLGAGAVAGTTLPLPILDTAKVLGFGRSFSNAMDAVSDRDFVADLVFATSLCSVHLSRLAEEIVLWTGSEFGFAKLDDAWSTGSSMMPQKRNPDVAELIRGRAGLGIGDLTALLSLLKGLPLAYDRDLQEDKTVVFGAVDRTLGCIQAMTALVSSLTFDPSALGRAASSGAAWATDLAERLVLRGTPFRDAHETVGKLVRLLEERQLTLTELSSQDLQTIDSRFEATDLEVASPSSSVTARAGAGGPGPSAVQAQIDRLRESVAGH